MDDACTDGESGIESRNLTSKSGLAAIDREELAAVCVAAGCENVLTRSLSGRSGSFQ